MQGVQRSLAGVEGATRSAHLQTGRLGNQFANLAGQIAHVHPVVGNLASVLGNFAIGAGLTVGVLAGVAAVAVAYDKLTDSSRKAMAQADKLIESYNRAARISALGIGGKEKADIEDINKGLEQHNKWLGFIIAARIQLGALGGLFGKDPGGHAAKIKASTSALEQAGKERDAAIADAKEKAAAKAKDAADKLAAATQKAADEAARYAKYMYEAGQFTVRMSGMLGNLGMADALKALGLAPSVAIPDTDISGISMPFDNLDKRQKDQLRQLGVLTDKADENAKMIQGAVLQSAQIIGSAVMQALNVGGGGRGSQIGGMIGAGIGGVLGSALGPPGSIITSGIGSVLGSVIGGLGGSLLGGLFDSNKKAVNENTNAVRALTQAMLLYAPAGFRAESYRYNASDPRPLDAFGRTVRWNASRGGANPLLGT